MEWHLYTVCVLVIKEFDNLTTEFCNYIILTSIYGVGTSPSYSMMGLYPSEFAR